VNQDPYCYPGTDVLVNLANIHDKAQLEMYEALKSTLNTAEKNTLKGPFDEDRLKATHKLLFGRVYAWAGKLRENTGTMTKGRLTGNTVTYGSHENVPQHLAGVFAALKAERYLKGLATEQFAKRLAYYYGELDTAHSFREGNSRTLRLFTAQLASEAGHTLDWARTSGNDADRDKLFRARDLAVVRADSSMLSTVVLSCLVTQTQERTSPLQAKETVMPTLTTEARTAPAYVYDLDTNLVHATLTGSKARDAAEALAKGGGDQYAMTHNADGLIFDEIPEFQNVFDTDRPGFSIAGCTLEFNEDPATATARAKTWGVAHAHDAGTDADYIARHDAYMASLTPEELGAHAAEEAYANEQRALLSDAIDNPSWNDWTEYAAGEVFLNEEAYDRAQAAFFKGKNPAAVQASKDATERAKARDVTNLVNAESLIAYDDTEAVEFAEEQDIDTLKDNSAETASKDSLGNTKASFISKEPIAVRLTEDQAKLLLSAEYPDDAPQQTAALYNVYNGGDDVNVMGDSVALDYSPEQKALYAALSREEKPALDQKLTQLRADNDRTRRAQQRPAKEPPARQQQRGGIERD
jgi:fido (protein-threonine AMPylation protein)